MTTATELPKVLPDNIIVFVLDNKVVQTLHTDDRLAAILLSNPLVLDVTDRGKQGVIQGDSYDPETKTFSRPTE